MITVEKLVPKIFSQIMHANTVLMTGVGIFKSISPWLSHWVSLIFTVGGCWSRCCTFSQCVVYGGESHFIFSPKGILLDLTQVTRQHGFDPVWVVLVVGTVTFILGFAGCVGALRENICLLKFVSFLSFIMSQLVHGHKASYGLHLQQFSANALPLTIVSSVFRNHCFNILLGANSGSAGIYVPRLCEGVGS